MYICILILSVALVLLIFEMWLIWWNSCFLYIQYVTFNIIQISDRLIRQEQARPPPPARLCYFCCNWVTSAVWGRIHFGFWQTESSYLYSSAGSGFSNWMWTYVDGVSSWKQMLSPEAEPECIQLWLISVDRIHWFWAGLFLSPRTKDTCHIF